MVDFKALVPWRYNKQIQAPAARGDYFDPFLTFRREMDRMFNDFLGRGGLRPDMRGTAARGNILRRTRRY